MIDRLVFVAAVCGQFAFAGVCLLGAQEPGGAAAEVRNVSGGVLRPDQACYDVQHYDLRLKVDPATKTIAGSLTMLAKAVGDCTVIALDLDSHLLVDKVSMGPAAEVPFVREGHRILIRPTPVPAAGKVFELTVVYSGTPVEAKNPPWTGGFTWKKTKDGKPWIATSCQGEGADLWWPCKDHPSDKPGGMDLHIAVPDGLVVASNGTLRGDQLAPRDDKKNAGWRTFDWQVTSPISNYCVALNIAPYERIDDTYTSTGGDKVKVQFFALPEHADKARKILPQFLDHVRVFEEILGPYPFRKEKYGVAETPHLGMEHQTIIAYGNGFRDARYDWLHNHELSHEWWGNLVTCKDWKDMWIHEGFGTYMQPLYLERMYSRKSKEEGRKAYAIEMKKNMHFVNQIAVAPRESMDSHQIYFSNGGSNDIYCKGAWVLHTLRFLLGDEKFFKCLRRFCYPTEAMEKVTDGSQVRLVDTDEFVKLCSQIAGADLGWFFEVYVRQPALPVIEQEVKDGVLQLHWKLPAGALPDGAAFELPVPVKVGERQERVAMPGGRGQCKVGKAEFAIDSDLEILMAR